MEPEEIKRKIRIRKKACENMTGEGQGYTRIQMSEGEIQKMLKELSGQCRQIDAYACMKIYGEIHAKNKIVWMIKRVLRKICHTCMGWYYVPVIEGQIDFNRQVKQVLEEISQLVQAQQEQLREHT